MNNGLYVVATPIGNLDDISKRALEVLTQADVIACEDTRVTRKLFALLSLDANKPFITYQDHNEEQQAQKLIDIINEGKALALVSDAGSPLISDPGYKLVRKCREQGVKVWTVPGCCAVISALQLSGLPTNRFMFAGFIPNKEKAREDLFKELCSLNSTLVFYETAQRIVKTLGVAQKYFQNREIAVAREITKLYEECLNGTAEELIQHFENTPPKGEMVLIKPLKSHTTNQFICGIRILSDTHPPIQIGQRIEIRVEKVQTRRIELTGRVCSLNKTNGSPLIFTEIILNQNQANLLYMEIKKSKVTIITENIFLGNIILNSFKSLF